VSGLIRISLAGLPPSSNHAYFNLPRGGRTLTTKGRGYKTETSAFVIRFHQNDIRELKRNHPYGLAVKLVFTNLYNETWPAKASSRYKKVDVSNRVKLLEDSLMDAFGLDDSQILDLHLGKRTGENEFTHILLWDQETCSAADAYDAYARL
jgi:Holliday junction resolvase RusA-like endonuclease